MSIHIESGNVYNDGYNTNESIYEFLLRKQDEEKQKNHTTLSDSETFSNYIRNFLDDIDHETVDNLKPLPKLEKRIIKSMKHNYLVARRVY